MEDRVACSFKDDFSNGELLRLIDTVPQHISVLGPDLNILYANQVLLDYHGLTRQDIQAKDTRAKYFHPDDLARLSREREDAILNGRPLETEARLLGKDGRYRWFLIRITPLRDENGSIIRWYDTRIDIDDRKKAEACLQLVIDTLPVMAATTLPDGSTDYVNQRWLDYYGLTLED